MRPTPAINRDHLVVLCLFALAALPAVRNGFAAEAEVGKIVEGSVALSIGLGDLDGVVGFQFDVVGGPSQVTAGYPLVSSPDTDHVAASRSLEDGKRRRLTVHSPTNTPFASKLDLQVPVTLKPAAPSGGPSIGLENLIFTDAGGNALPITVRYPGIEQWRRLNFTAEERLDPEIIGDDRDPDGDGLNNLGEFFAGTPPKIANAGDAPRRADRADPGTGDSNFAVRFWKAKSGVDGEASGTAEVSFDLLSWTTDGVRVEPTGVESETSMELEAWVEVSPEAEAPARVFLRIDFERQ